MYEFIAQGKTVTSRANWYEYSWKSNKYLLNWANTQKKKTGIRKWNTETDQSTTNPKEIQLLYATHYDNEVNFLDEI